MQIKCIIEWKIPHNEKVEGACLGIHACFRKASVRQFCLAMNVFVCGIVSTGDVKPGVSQLLSSGSVHHF